MIARLKIKGTEEVGFLLGFSSGACSEGEWEEVLLAMPDGGIRIESAREVVFTGFVAPGFGSPLFAPPTEREAADHE